MKKMVLFASCLSMVSVVSAAGMDRYGASISQSSWKLAVNTPLECRFEHQIPGWGSGSFVSYANKLTNMDFELKPLRPQAKIQSVTVRSMPPVWRPGVADSSLSKMKMYTQFNGYLSGKAAWSMIDELEGGNNPSFLFRDWYHQERPITVTLSAIGFRAKYQEFLGCMQGLLPYSFDDISYTVLTYDKQTETLTPYSQRRLNMIAVYLKADPTLDLAMISAHTDSLGDEDKNLDISVRRAGAVKKFFADLGIDEKRITATGDGEKYLVQANDTEKHREGNRRIIVTLQRWTPSELNFDKNKTASR